MKLLQLGALQGYRDDQGLYLESDTDDQLLIHIPFNQGNHCSIESVMLHHHGKYI